MANIRNVISRMQSILKLSAVSMATAVLASCSPSSYTHPLTHGVLLDSASQVPIADAQVVMVWHGDQAQWADSVGQCLRLVVARTDATGHFKFPAWRRDIPGIIKSSVWAKWYIFKIGTDVGVVGDDGFNNFRATPSRKYLIGRIDDQGEWIRTVLTHLPSGCIDDVYGWRAEHALYEDLARQIEALPNAKKPIKLSPTSLTMTPVEWIRYLR